MPLTDFAWFALLLLPLTAAMAWLLTGAICRNAHRLQLIDAPSERSAHGDLRPRGGGLAIVISSVLALAVSNSWHQEGSWSLWWLASCAWPVALVGLLDDRRSLPPHWRLGVQVVMAVILTALVMPLPPVLVGSWLLPLSALGWLLVPPAVVWLVNLYNFMDGIDALAAQQAAFVCMALLLLLGSHAPALSLLVALLLAAVLGFAAWNLPPARIFMGDVGSNYIGFMLAILALVTLQQELLNLWSWLLLMAVFIADTAVTLLVRWRRGDALTQAHNRHAYQHLSRRWHSHGRVVLAVMVINLCWLLPLAWLAAQYPEYGVLLTISGIVPLLLVASCLGAGRPERSWH